MFGDSGAEHDPVAEADHGQRPFRRNDIQLEPGQRFGDLKIEQAARSGGDTDAELTVDFGSEVIKFRFRPVGLASKFLAAARGPVSGFRGIKRGRIRNALPILRLFPAGRSQKGCRAQRRCERTGNPAWFKDFRIPKLRRSIPFGVVEFRHRPPVRHSRIEVFLKAELM
ncbi:hypothetical protein SDC9_140507 [bioreactor metagenome]|uniref:Uncharacterized protein n=1 Tax=bioreactor metagenome TaxID=1076179 RepID=A0A645DV40_9ZZZZ